jgi:hypothetical protein
MTLKVEMVQFHQCPVVALVLLQPLVAVAVVALVVDIEEEMAVVVAEHQDIQLMRLIED